jgi:hypothetical protein
MEPHNKIWIQQVSSKMTNKEVADNILLYFQHSDLSVPVSKEAEIAGYKLFLWAELTLENKFSVNKEKAIE